MTLANETQVGGTHYACEYQHWDLVHDVGFGYLEGQISKYVCRWRKKNGVQDLQKAAHFAAKLQEVFIGGGVSKQIVSPDIVDHCIKKFANHNSLEPREIGICVALTRWADVRDLQIIRNMIDEMIEIANAGQISQ
jgi:hypothetical protein